MAWREEACKTGVQKFRDDVNYRIKYGGGSGGATQNKFQPFQIVPPHLTVSSSTTMATLGLFDKFSVQQKYPTYR